MGRRGGKRQKTCAPSVSVAGVVRGCKTERTYADALHHSHHVSPLVGRQVRLLVVPGLPAPHPPHRRRGSSFLLASFSPSHRSSISPPFSSFFVKSPKAAQLRTIVSSEFRKNAKESDPEKLSQLKFATVRAMSNYLVLESTERDPRLKSRIDKWKPPR